MNLGDVVHCATAAPAKAIGRPELGVLSPGGPGDATVIEVEDGDFVYRDENGERVDGRHRVACRGMVVDGEWRDAGQGADVSGPTEEWCGGVARTGGGGGKRGEGRGGAGGSRINKK